MTGFRYQALNPSGQTETGVVEADSPRLARQSLRQRGLSPIDVQEIVAQSKASHGAWGAWRQRLSVAELALLTRQAAGLLGARLTIEDTLNALIQQSESTKVREIVASVRAEVIGGQSLSKSLAQRGDVFNSLYRTLVAAGERSGQLPEIMESLARYLEKRAELQMKVRLALLYPAVISVVAISVVTGLLIWVMPQVAEVFTRQHQTLPWITRCMLALSHFVRTWGLALLLGLGVGVWQLRRRWKEPASRRVLERCLLSIPGLGRLMRTVNASRLSSTLAILVGAGVPLMDALDASHGVVNLLVVGEALKKVGHAVREGRSLSRSLAEAGYFPVVMVHLIESGERSGELPTMLTHVARLMDQEVEERATVLTKLLEPMLILGMGLMVLMIILSIMLPIFELNQIIR